MDSNLTAIPHPFFSIVIPSYNRALFITKLVEGFLQQTYPHFELIIVDDGSTDNTREVLTALQDVRIKYYRKENGERGAARCYGAARATGDYINYFDSDDLPYKDHLQTACEAIVALGNPSVFHLGYEIKNEQGTLLYRRELVNGKGNQKLLRVNYINPNPLFVHKDTLAAVTYNEDRALAATEDWLYHLQLAARYDFIAFDEKITSCMIQHHNRSMNAYSGDAVLQRNKVLLHYLNADAVFMMQYGKDINKIAAEMHGLAALHYVLEKKKLKAMQLLLSSCRLSPRLIFKRRTLAIFKYIIL